MADTSMGDTSMAGTASAAAADADTMPVFRIGLVMAGAVSAGAYTAGVVDFLLEALDAIEDVRAGRDRSDLKAGFDDETELVAPPYGAQIGAMSGTSAGAMVTAITTAVLNTRFPPVTGATQPGVPTGNPLYDCWVDQIHIDKLLSTDDLGDDKPLRSLLNSEPLDAIVDAALPYADRTDHPRAYVQDHLPVYMCVGNMRGVAYSLRLEGPEAVSGHQMTLHADNLAFELEKAPGPAVHKERLALVPGTGASTTEPWQFFGKACLASGAFPFGLAPRLLKRDFDDYLNREWFVPGTVTQMERVKDAQGNDLLPVDSPKSWTFACGEFQKVMPLYTSAAFGDGRYPFVCVDGGVFNNEPLELCRRALSGAGRNPRDPRKANAAVLMIDPFPDPAAAPDAFDPGAAGSLVGVAARLLGVLIAQSRFKPEELALARDENVASRFAILPSRRHPDPKDDRRMSPAIASGGVNAFGGFLSREFRHHDFMLGRRNCQRFLATGFVLPADPVAGDVNPIVGPWLSDPRHDQFLGSMPIGDRKVKALPIIPLLGKLASKHYTTMPPWPETPADLDLATLSAKVKARLDKVAPKLIDTLHLPCGWCAGARMAYGLGKSKLVKWVMSQIRTSLTASGLRPR
jgi:predicted acylesterase/phospholipase RssA